MDGTKEVRKCKFHLKVFQLFQAWAFPRIRKGNCWLCVLEEKN
jgi:hypothetical protein